MSQIFIPLLKDDYQLDEQKIDIWQFSLNMPISSQEWEILSTDEIIRYKRFYFAQHQRRFALARIRLRQILALYLNQESHTLKFDYLSHGKPIIENSQHLQFNLSHSKDLALLSIGKKYDMGIDLEFFSPRYFLGVSRNLFSQNEQHQLQHLPAYMLPIAFFNIWAQKEAFIKAIGLGLAYPTESFSVPVLPHSKSTIITDKDSDWHIKTFAPVLACRSAICYHPTIKQINYGIYETLFTPRPPSHS